jgi:hypothetical protein
MKLICRSILLGFFLVGTLACSESEQQPDPDFIPKNIHRSFLKVNSPIVFIDEAHNNLHQISGRFKPFSQVLISDGYTVKSSKEKFTLEYLRQADILVIVNALDKKRQDYNPPYGEAFEIEEIEAVKQWVSQGGSLFLVADHAPFPKVIDKLAIAFGFEFTNGHVDDAIFNIDNNGLLEHAITKESTDPKNYALFGVTATPMMSGIVNNTPHSQTITQVKSFGGAAFQIPENAKSLLLLGKRAVSIVPSIPFQVNAKTPRISVDGWSQGAVLEIGKGRVAVFSEAMMFTSQVYSQTGKKMGLVSDGAEQNEQFLLNIMHWLSGLI